MSTNERPEEEQAEHYETEEQQEEVETSEQETTTEDQGDDYKSLYLRTLADFDNYRRRKEQELQEARDRAIKDFAEDLLPIIDNFEMSLKMGTQDTEGLRKGVEMIHKNLHETLQNYHITSYTPEQHMPFDPHHHEPVVVESEEHAPGTIVNVLQRGYQHKGKILRPARVQVVKEEEDTASEEEQSS